MNFSFVQLRRLPKLDSLRLIYMALFQSNLCYGLGIFGGTADTVLAPLIIVQRQAAKIILKLPKRYPSVEVLDLLGVPSLQELYVRDLKRLYLSFRYKFDKIQHRHETRGNVLGLLKGPKAKLEVTRRNITYNLIKHYNDCLAAGEIL